MEKRTTGVLSLMALLILMFGTSFAKAGERVQPDDLTKKELKLLAANARTPEDHRKLAAYNEQEVQRERAETQKAEQELVAEQAHPANRSAKNPNGRLNYFQYEVAHHRDAAEKALASAAMHREMAGIIIAALSPVSCFYWQERSGGLRKGSGVQPCTPIPGRRTSVPIFLRSCLAVLLSMLCSGGGGPIRLRVW